MYCRHSYQGYLRCGGDHRKHCSLNSSRRCNHSVCTLDWLLCFTSRLFSFNKTFTSTGSVHTLRIHDGLKWWVISIDSGEVAATVKIRFSSSDECAGSFIDLSQAFGCKSCADYHLIEMKAHLVTPVCMIWGLSLYIVAASFNRVDFCASSANISPKRRVE